MMKKILTGTLAALMVAGAASLTTFAAKDYTVYALYDHLSAYDEDGELISDQNKVNFVGSSIAATEISIDPLQPGQTIYIPINLETDGVTGTDDFHHNWKYDFQATSNNRKYIINNDLTDSKLYSVSLKKTEGAKLINKVEIVTEKSIEGYQNGARKTFLKIVVNDNTGVDEYKFKGTLEIKAKKSAYAGNLGNYSKGTEIDAGDRILIPMTLWVKNEKVNGDDYDAETGARIVFNPSNNEKNTLIWGDDRAALYFEANDDASKFYARLSTKSNSTVYAKYGDPQNVDLWFYDFVGNPTIPATSRATLTLGIPWDDDANHIPTIADCHIYELHADGTLTEVKSFTYDDANDSTTRIEGWSIKTRQLGTYVLAEKELLLEEDSSAASTAFADDTVSRTICPPAVNSTYNIPNTGSSDVGSIAVVAAIVSLAAGAVAFRKMRL